MRADPLRDHALAALDGRHAHLDFDAAVEGLGAELAGRRAPGLPHTAWELVEHLRMALADLVGYARDAGHVSPEWPAGYWPAAAAPESPAAWEESLAAYRFHREEMRDLLRDPARDLLAPLPWSEGAATLLREALLAANHASYHLGQVVSVRQALGAWPA